jgi:hypothetical protein
LLLEEGADPSEVALVAALLRASPEVKRLSDWASTMHSPKGVLPLHAGTFALLGAIYFHINLVRFDAAFASRTVDEYGAPDRKGEEPKTGMLKMLQGLAKEEHSLVGYLASRETIDSNTSSQMHLLGGILAAPFAELSREQRSKKRTLLGTLLSVLTENTVPAHLTDIGLLEQVLPSHVDLVTLLGEESRQRMAREQRAQAQSEAEKKTRQETAEREKQDRLAKEQGYLPTKKALERIFLVVAGKDSSSTKVTQGDRTAMVLSAYDLVQNASSLSDSALYVILDHCPRGSSAFLRGAMLPLRKKIEDAKRREHETGWGLAASLDNVSLGLLWEALSKVELVADPVRFAALPHELLRFIQMNSVAGEEKVYTEEFLTCIRRAVLSLYEERCAACLPSS